MTTGPLDGGQMRPAKALGLSTAPQITPWKQIEVRRGDTLSGIFARIGLGGSQWRALLDLGHSTRALRHLQPGDKLAIRKTPTGKLSELRFRLDSQQTLEVDRRGAKLHGHIDKRLTRTREVTASGKVGASLSNALAAGGVPGPVAAQMSRIYRYRQNLRTLSPNDKFALVYRETYSGGREISSGPILAASVTDDNHNYRAFRARDAQGDTGYYNTVGQPYAPAFTRKPVAYTRISSRFSMHRMNPITHKIRPHLGVDMAAPTGTPIHAAAAGTVEYAGWATGYGRLVELKNFDGYSTRYAHMSKIFPNLHSGEHVGKGEVIGYVGESGEATGPHLHFEIRRRGVAHNPLTVRLPPGHALSKHRMAAYTRKIQPLIAKLTPAPTTLLAKTAATPTDGDRCTRATSSHATLALDLIGAARRHRSSPIFCVVEHDKTRA